MTLDELELDIYSLLLQNGEMRFSEIANQLYQQQKYAHRYGIDTFKVILSRKLGKMAFLEKKNLGHQNVRYSIPQKEKEEIEKMVKHHRNLEFLSKLPPEEIERILKELKYYQLKSQLLSMKIWSLPGMAVEKKLEQLGYKPSDYKLYNVVWGEGYDDYTPEDIEFRDLTDWARWAKPLEQKEIGKWRLDSHIFGKGFKIVAYIKTEKKAIVGAYKKVIELYDQLEKMEEEFVKEEFKLTDEDIKRVDWKLLKNFPLKGAEFWRYVASKKPNAFEMFVKDYMQEGFDQKTAKRLVKDEFRFYQTLEKDIKEAFR